MLELVCFGVYLHTVGDCNPLNAKWKKPPPLLWRLLVAFLLLSLVVLLAKRMEGRPPEITLTLKSPFLGAGQTLTIEVADKESGLRKVWAAVVKDGQETVLFEKSFPAGNLLKEGGVRTQSLAVPVDPKAWGINDGRALLRLVARDYSWRQWGDGNRSYQEREVIIDTRVPGISVISRSLNLAQGGSGLVIYKLSEDCPASGVDVGANHFPGHGGYFKDPLTRLAFVALDYRQGSDTPIAMVAQDFAGNQSRVELLHHINRRRFKRDTITLSDDFLNRKMPEFRSLLRGEAATPPENFFLKVNTDLRRRNYEQIVKITSRSDETLHWQGAFSRLRGSANLAGFAEHRQYKYKGKVIDKQTHLGIDLAALRNTPVPAANSGLVVFADNLGIYGLCVIIDHGFSLFSMYAHLSVIDVAPDQMVTAGHIIGKTGSSGLAGGDHLHFGMLVRHTFVNPLEWWDAQWIKNNIYANLNAAQ